MLLRDNYSAAWLICEHNNGLQLAIYLGPLRPHNGRTDLKVLSRCTYSLFKVPLWYF